MYDLFELRIIVVISVRRRLNLSQLVCVFVHFAFYTLFYVYVS